MAGFRLLTTPVFRHSFSGLNVSTQLDRHLRTLLGEILATDRASRSRDITTHHRLNWVLRGVVSVVVVGRIAYLATRNEQSAPLSVTTQAMTAAASEFAHLQAKLDAIARNQQLQANLNATPTLSDEDRKTLEEIKRRGDTLQKTTTAALERQFGEANRLLDTIDEKQVTEEPVRFFAANGHVAYFAGNFDTAIDAYETALRIRPDDFSARIAGSAAVPSPHTEGGRSRSPTRSLSFQTVPPSGR